ncbi:cation diffusion facilitator family transporter [Propioniciclava soli]|uniref:Cation diffusion facilitator family transporter n=1 Tax=Propioniciclava soli TaxID=2775081 RepID=A0ABZ3C4B6_9ACTN
MNPRRDAHPQRQAHQHQEHEHEQDKHQHEHDGHQHDHHGAHDHDHDHGDDWWARVRHAITPHSHDHAEAMPTAEEASKEGIRTAWISLAGMAATAALQLVIVAVSGSIGLLADTLHNLGHLVTTIPLIIAFRLGRRAPTRRYPFGLRRAEDLVGLLIGLVIAISAALIIAESVRALVDPRPMTNPAWVLAAALIGAAGNEIVAIYRIRTGRRIGSAALIAEGQHARTDALTSLAVIGGVVGTWAGFPQVDALVGLLMGAVIVGVLISTVRVTVRRLMDGVEDGTLDQIERTAADVPGVRRVERSRARWSGHRMEADLDIAVDPGLTVAAAHTIAVEVHSTLLRAVRHLDRVSVHVEPDGVACGPSLSLPAPPPAAA